MSKVAIFDFIEQYSEDNDIAISRLCKIFEVLERTFYKHRKKVIKQSNLLFVLSKIYEILDEKQEHENYGVSRMRIALQQDKNINVSNSTVRRAMKKGNLIHKNKRLANSLTRFDINAQKIQNIIKRNFKADKPNEKWLTDIT